jgi:hypothetical protein
MLLISEFFGSGNDGASADDHFSGLCARDHNHDITSTPMHLSPTGIAQSQFIMLTVLRCIEPYSTYYMQYGNEYQY